MPCLTERSAEHAKAMMFIHSGGDNTTTQAHVCKKGIKTSLKCLYFSEKSAAVVLENWNVFCFVMGEVDIIPPG